METPNVTTFTGTPPGVRSYRQPQMEVVTSDHVWTCVGTRWSYGRTHQGLTLRKTVFGIRSWILSWSCKSSYNGIHLEVLTFSLYPQLIQLPENLSFTHLVSEVYSIPCLMRFVSSNMSLHPFLSPCVLSLRAWPFPLATHPLQSSLMEGGPRAVVFKEALPGYNSFVA